MTAPPTAEEILDVERRGYYHMQCQLKQRWQNQFQGTGATFIARYDGDLGTTFTNDHVLGLSENLLQNPNLGMECLRILESCMESELEFTGTFWLECLHTIMTKDLLMDYEGGKVFLFENFIRHMIGYNETFKRILPAISSIHFELHRAATLLSKYAVRDDALMERVLKTTFLDKYKFETVITRYKHSIGELSQPAEDFEDPFAIYNFDEAITEEDEEEDESLAT